ncbi:MAG: type II toxin-antitoxin system VapC family toxin [Thermoanaerobaculia bacterium]
MIVDSSAVTSIFLRKSGCERLIDALADSGFSGVGAPTLAEASLELAEPLGADVHALLARFVQEFDLQIVPFSDAHYRAAVDAYQRYGAGRHTAALDFGDCLAYATARLAKQPLLCDDERFRATDLPLA